MNNSTEIFNWPALAVGCSALLLCLLVQGGAVVVVMTEFKNRIRALAIAKRVVTAHLMFFSAILILLMAHIVQIYLWGLFLFVPGIIGNIHQAMLLAGSTYTTVGFVNDTLALQWQLLSVVMAITGLFAFAWSTSIMYGLSQQLYRVED